MEAKKKAPVFTGLFEKIRHNRFLLAAMLTGVFVLVLTPSGGRSDREAESEGRADKADIIEYSLREEEKRLEKLLSQIDGAGEMRVMLSLKSGAERVLARDTDVEESGQNGEAERQERRQTVLASSQGKEEAITIRYIYPEYQGAIVVAEGADSADMCLKLTKAVMALTGLGADRISIAKMEVK